MISTRPSSSGFSARAPIAALPTVATANPAPSDDKPVASAAAAAEPAPARINRYRTLGRTGFRVSDISMGCGSIAEPNVVRYAYDHGMNLFDTAETYVGEKLDAVRYPPRRV